MIWKRTPSVMKFMATASVVALGASAVPAMAQDAVDDTADAEGDVIIVSGIRASLEDAMNIKRDAIGVVDAISAEDIGKFPDTNLAESLQRITGVSIDRQNGEGSKVTVRGFGPDFNLVLLNGRQMPASGLGSCCEAPASRSFDFANLASEGVAGVEVYKSGRASLPTGGIGSVINIKTARPLDRDGFKGSIGVKGVMDHGFDGRDITPEVSGIVSQTFGDDKFGILLSGSYQKRKGSFSQFSAGWREGYLGNDSSSWGSLPPVGGDWRGNRVENHPEATDIYQTTQNAAYDFVSFERERINGQAVLQFKPSDEVTATLDYTYSKYTLDARTSSIGVWFNHNQTSSSWTDGPNAGPNFYSEDFGPNEGKDLAITGALAKNQNENKSLGFNLEWEHPSGWHFALDAHHSTAVSKPTSPYGSNIAVGSAIYGVRKQTVDFTTDLPSISVEMYPGSEIDPSNIRPAGNAFRNAYMRDRINEVALHGGKDFDTGLITSLDFGASYIDNKVLSQYGFIQNDSWGGTLPASQVPDDFYTPQSTSENLAGMDGANVAGMIPTYYDIKTAELIGLLDDTLGICANTTGGPGTCLAAYSVIRPLREKTLAPYLQTLHTFDILAGEAHFRAGLRYEVTDVSTNSQIEVPVGTVWVAQNEISILRDPNNVQQIAYKASYDNWLPAFDLDFTPIQDVVLRASYSHMITRAGYADLAPGLTVNSPARPNGGSTGGAGNPGIIPYLSKGFDLSAEWYYGNASYLSVGYFNKKVSNFISNITTNSTAFDLTNPAQGAAANAARAALGNDASFADILAYVATNFPNLVTRNGAGDPTGILSTANDPDLIFTLTQRGNTDQTARVDGFEFAIQHNFWDTGFGAIFNYTIVNSNRSYDNTLQYQSPQFAIPGVSDSANAVLFYDKNGLQARIAYNWRDEFLAGYGLDPYYINAYGQFDASVSYEFPGGFTVFGEAINLTNEDQKGHMRADQAVTFASPGHARYAAGVRFTW